MQNDIKPVLNKPILNKKNLIKFAKNLYKDTGKKIEYMPLCEGALAKANGQVLHCALGELHEEFIGKIARRATKDELKKRYNNNIQPYDGFISKKDSMTKKAVVIFKQDDKVIDDLINIAKIKNKAKFNMGMNNIAEINDEAGPYEEEYTKQKYSKQDLYIERAKNVQEHLLEIAEYLE